MISRKSLLSVGVLALLATTASAQQFNGGIPAGWVCVGTCGTLGANGVVTLAPGGGTSYGYVSTVGGVNGVALEGVGGGCCATDGSTLRSAGFNATSGDALAFNFQYVTSDGSGFADYAWARLLDASFNQVALLFTARTDPSANIVPGNNMPAPAATLTPSSVSIITGTDWSPLGGYSGLCFAAGCGHSGWVQASYSIAATGTYFLEFGVTNWADQLYDSGFAFDGLSLNNVPIGDVVPGPLTDVPEPATLGLVATGLVAVAGIARRRRKGLAAAA
jgi:hypothetical protein